MRNKNFFSSLFGVSVRTNFAGDQLLRGMVEHVQRFVWQIAYRSSMCYVRIPTERVRLNRPGAGTRSISHAAFWTGHFEAQENGAFQAQSQTCWSYSPTTTGIN